MNVLIVCHHALPHIGGVEVLVHREICALTAAGHHVSLITSDGTGSGDSPSYSQSVTEIRVPAWHVLERRFRIPYPLFSPSLVMHLWREIGRCDCVHVHGFMFMSSFFALLIAWLRGKRTILTDHGGIQTFDSRLATTLATFMAHTVGRTSVQLADHLVAYNMRIVKLLDRLAGRQGKTQFLPNPVDWELFCPAGKDRRRALRQHYRWSDERPKVLFLSRLVPEKGVRLLLEARDPNFDLVFCGPGDPQILGTPLPPGVEYFPPRPLNEVVKLYQAVDLFILPTGVREGFPLVIQEALACGLKVIAGYDPGFEPYRRLPGLTFCERNPESLKQTILEALRSEPLQDCDRGVLREFCPPLEVWVEQLYGRCDPVHDGRADPEQSGVARDIELLGSTTTTPFNLEVSQKRKPAVAFANPAGMSIGGVTTWSLGMVRRINEAGGHGVLLNHPRANLQELAPQTYADVPIEPCYSVLNLGNVRDNLEKYKSTLPATIIPNWSAETYGLCARLSRTHASQMRVIGFCHTYEAFYFWFLQYYEPIIHRFVAVSEECAQVLREKMPLRRNDIVVRPYPVVPPPSMEKRGPSHERPLRLLYAGRIEQVQKRVFDLVELAITLYAQQVNFQLRIVGEGSDKRALQDRVLGLVPGIRQRISVEKGVAPDVMPSLFSASDVCVLTSEYEGTSIFMLEGMAHGCVPVVTRVSGTRGTITDGANGFVRDVGDISGLATAIGRLDRNRGMLAQMSAAAFARGKEFSVDEYMAWFLSLCDSVWSDEPRSWNQILPFVPGLNYTLRKIVGLFPGFPRALTRIMQRTRMK